MRILSFFKPRYETARMLAYYQQAQYGHQDFYEKISIAIKPYVSGSTRALDVGCAMGRMVFEFAKLGVVEPYGIDRSKAFIERANQIKNERGQTSVKFIQGDIFKYHFAHHSFDVVSCINVIDRVANPSLLVEKIFRLTKPRGVILLVDPYDWEFSPTPKKLHVSDMKDLLPPSQWSIEKEMRDIQFVMPISPKQHRTYLCHLIIGRIRT